ncbi:GPI mannosyltransferase 2 [Periplaneta americana]|uniref:GPI mannosyltransferase 2 n=1 Tax=Periplaneta americana TaxID=6978 RepID=UPI0037E706EE
MLTPHEKIVWFAVISRLFILFLSAFFNFIIPDHNADAFVSPRDPTDRVQTTVDLFVKHLFGGLVRWDAQYFIHVASYGYTYENCLAFFPLYPMIIRVFAGSLHYCLQGFLSRYSVFVVSSVLINFVTFVLSALVLYRLSLQVLKSAQLAYKAAILYCVNPASIFFVAPYSETLFAFLTFYGMLKCGNRSSKVSSVGCGLLFGLAAIQRSNGTLNLGFIVHEKLKYFLKFVLPDVVTKAKRVDSVFVAPLLLIPPVIAIISLIGEIILAITPFVMFQGYGYYKFCIVPNHNLPYFLVSHARINHLKLPGTSLKSGLDNNHWCNSTIPLAYSYVQDHYWNVGFLRYYHWKQIPNFLLAIPIIWIILVHAYRFVKQHPNQCRLLGLWEDPSRTDDPKVIEKMRIKMKQNEIKYAPEMLVYIVHVVFLTIFCTLCIHVQVTTRMVASASPVLYWFIAYHFFKPTVSKDDFESKKPHSRNTNYFATRLRLISSNKKESRVEEEVDSLENLESRWKVFIITDKIQYTEVKLIKYYFLSYIVLGTALFSNFLPWT